MKFTLSGVICDWPRCQNWTVLSTQQGAPEELLRMMLALGAQPGHDLGGWLDRNRKQYCPDHSERAKPAAKIVRGELPDDIPQDVRHW